MLPKTQKHLINPYVSALLLLPLDGQKDAFYRTNRCLDLAFLLISILGNGMKIAVPPRYQEWYCYDTALRLQ